MKLRELVEDLEGADIAGDDGSLEIGGIACDSRRVREGDLFVALEGARLDGRRFAGDAVGRGASAVMASRDGWEGEEERASLRVPRVLVPDARAALALAAASFYGYPARDLRLIGVTGTNGKTTTTWILESILKEAGHGVGVVGTVLYRWGDKERAASMTTPESLELQRLLHEMRRDGVTHVVMEVSSHALALGRVRGCGFQSAVFTNLSQDHLDFHKDLEDYFNVKASLFRNHLNDHGKGASAVVNGEDFYGQRLRDDLRKGLKWKEGPRGPWGTGTGERELWSYSVERGAGGEGDGPKVWVKAAELGAEGVRAELETPAGIVRLRSSLLGRLNLYNLLAASTAALSLGVPPRAIEKGVERMESVDGRLQKVETSRDFHVVVDYAHTPDAMEKSLACLRELARGRLIVVFGCGGDRDRGKRPLMGETAARLGDLVVVTSDNPRSEDPRAIIDDIREGMDKEEGLAPYRVEPDRRKAIRLALSLALPGDLVYIGGKGHETYQIIGDRRLSFDDRLEVRKGLASLS